MYSTIRAAWPRQTTSTPVASGSRVPAWPTRRSPLQRRTMETTAKEVLPAGLRTLRIPSTLTLSLRLSLAGAHLIDKLDDLAGLLHGVIVDKAQVRSVA